MTKIEYVEDALTEFLSHCLFGDPEIDWQDHTILNSLHHSIDLNQALTQKQSRLLLKILSKYKNFSNDKLDLEEVLINPKWKNNFRKLDLTKTVLVEKDSSGVLWIVVKLPYELSKEFDKCLDIDSSRLNVYWDAERKVRKLKFHSFNIMVIDDFARKHNFIIDDSFVEAVNQVEEIWQQYENISRCSEIIDGSVRLLNAPVEVENYFAEHQQTTSFENIFLAKTMGYPLLLKNNASNIVEKIASQRENHFWIKENNPFFDVYKKVGGYCAVIIDRNTKDVIRWLENFVQDADSNAVSRHDIRVCFRESKDSDIPLNDWIRHNNLGGKIESGKIFIFKHKPAKWIFSNNIDVKIVVTNSFTPPSDPTTRMWLEWHPCVLFASDIEPTEMRNKRIVNL